MRPAVARSPRSAEAGSPGRALIHRKTRIESPRRIGTRRSSRRTTKRSIYVVVRRPTTPFSLDSPDRHESERLERNRAGRVALDRLLESERRARVCVRDTGQVIHDDLVRLLVELGALGLVRLRARLLQDVEDLVVVEVELGGVRPEEDAEEVVGVSVVARPADQVQV